ncbi:hypothetical protein Tco_1171636 [Tanacetum coccineum]
MSSPYLIVNRVGSMVPLVKPLDIRKFESLSYHALGACLIRMSFLRRKDSIYPIHSFRVVTFEDVPVMRSSTAWKLIHICVRRSYALSWKPCQGSFFESQIKDSYKDRDGDTSF